jgi:hypothetical protein
MGELVCERERVATKKGRCARDGLHGRHIGEVLLGMDADEDFQVIHGAGS